MSHSSRSSHKINVLFVIDYLLCEYGGSERQLIQILRYLDRSRFTPALCQLWKLGHTQEMDLRCSQAALSQRSIPWILAPFYLSKLHRLITAGKFDVVHTFFPTSNILGVLAARLAAVPVIISSRRDLGFWKKWRHKTLLRAVRKAPTCYLANCVAVKQETAKSERIDPRRIAVVHNGVDLQWFSHDVSMKAECIRRRHQVPEGTLVVGVVANYYREVKGVHYLIKAAGPVAAEINNVRFFIVGQGSQDQDTLLQNNICRLGLENHFIFTGLQKDIRPFLSLFDVGVLPSLSEGFSNSLLEYMAAGIPSVASDVGGNRELISDGESGFLVKPASPKALASKIILLLKDARLRATLGQHARGVVHSCFSVRNMVHATQTLYEDLLLSAPRRKK